MLGPNRAHDDAIDPDPVSRIIRGHGRCSNVIDARMKPLKKLLVLDIDVNDNLLSGQRYGLYGAFVYAVIPSAVMQCPGGRRV